MERAWNAIDAVQPWTTWEMATSKLYVDPAMIARAEGDQFALAFARIEWCVCRSCLLMAMDCNCRRRVSPARPPICHGAFAQRLSCSHYFVNAGFFKYDGQLLQEVCSRRCSALRHLAQVYKIKHIPCTIVQARSACLWCKGNTDSRAAMILCARWRAHGTCSAPGPRRSCTLSTMPVTLPRRFKRTRRRAATHRNIARHHSEAGGRGGQVPRPAGAMPRYASWA